MMHHCTKFGENRSRIFCVIASQTPKIHIFLIRKAEDPPPPKKKKKKKKRKRKPEKKWEKIWADEFNTDCRPIYMTCVPHVLAHLHVASSNGLFE